MLQSFVHCPFFCSKHASPILFGTSWCVGDDFVVKSPVASIFNWECLCSQLQTSAPGVQHLLCWVGPRGTTGGDKGPPALPHRVSGALTLRTWHWLEIPQNDFSSQLNKPPFVPLFPCRRFKCRSSVFFIFRPCYVTSAWPKRKQQKLFLKMTTY